MTEVIDRLPKTFEWQDEETEAQGWIVIDRLINGVSGGGLFMHAHATLKEVKDLALTMSLKNSLQDPQFGGGKGGIRFDPSSPKANGVLRRFMIAHKRILETEWSTGGDLYTSHDLIEKIAQEDLGLPSAFSALAEMICRRATTNMASQAGEMRKRISHPINEFFTLGGAATGFSVAESVRLVGPRFPRIAIQGFGNVGRGLAYFLASGQVGNVVGICEKDGFLVAKEGVDVERLFKASILSDPPSAILKSFADQNATKAIAWFPRAEEQSDADLLQGFLKNVQANVLSPCATRYCLTSEAIESFLINGGTHIICGANNVFVSSESRNSLIEENITILPEWVSNSGNAILFAESLKIRDWKESTPGVILNSIRERIVDFVEESQKLGSEQTSLYDSCHRLAWKRMDAFENIRAPSGTPPESLVPS